MITFLVDEDVRPDGPPLMLVKRASYRRQEMSNISRDDVIAIFGPLDDAVAAEIIATGATPEELELARAWVARDAAGTKAQGQLPSGPVGKVIHLVERVRAAKEHPIQGSPFGESGSTLE